jgi:hypothetical protein
LPACRPSQREIGSFARFDGEEAPILQISVCENVDVHRFVEIDGRSIETIGGDDVFQAE